MTDSFIWYNPDQNLYEKGGMIEFDASVKKSPNKDRYVILYEFSDASPKVVDKVLTALNVARTQELEFH